MNIRLPLITVRPLTAAEPPQRDHGMLPFTPRTAVPQAAARPPATFPLVPQVAAQASAALGQGSRTSSPGPAAAQGFEQGPTAAMLEALLRKASPQELRALVLRAQQLLDAGESHSRIAATSLMSAALSVRMRDGFEPPSGR